MKASQLLVQISDTHLGAAPGYELRGVNTRYSLKAVLDAATEYLTEADRIIVTGDISHDETAASYSLIQQMLSGFDGPKSYLPGNHDKSKLLREVLGLDNWPTCDKLGHWRLVSLNSLVEGEEGGYLDDEALQRLEAKLSENSSQPIIVALHHPPIPLGSQWIDEISLANQVAFRSLLSQHQQVRAVIFGHAHQSFDVLLDGVRWLCCPSTCLQFLPNSKGFAIDESLPGYRWLRLYDDGTLDTAVGRIESWPEGSKPNP